jgi:hypothetical protein
VSESTHISFDQCDSCLIKPRLRTPQLQGRRITSRSEFRYDMCQVENKCDHSGTEDICCIVTYAIRALGQRFNTTYFVWNCTCVTDLQLQHAFSNVSQRFHCTVCTLLS